MLGNKISYLISLHYIFSMGWSSSFIVLNLVLSLDFLIYTFNFELCIVIHLGVALVQGLGLFIQKFSFMPMEENNEENISITQVSEITFELCNYALQAASFSLLVVSAEITFREQLIFFASLAVAS